jgi:O-methyltransferase
MADQNTRTTVNEVVVGRRYAWNEAKEREWHPDIHDDEFWEITREVWDYTVLGSAALYNIYTSIDYVVSARINGDFVECGVFMGGSIMFTAEMCKRHRLTDRAIYALDTFRGFVRRSELDVDFHGKEFGFPVENAESQRTIAEANIRSVGWRADLVNIVEGDVLDTCHSLPTQQIAVLRLDTDTYDTTKVELEALYPRVSPRGVVIVDDYGWGRGQRAAVDEYFAHQRVCIMRIDQYTSAFVKP